MAAVIIQNTDITVTKINELCNRHTACVCLDWCGGQLYVGSTYCQSGQEIGPYEKLPGKQILLGMDANEKSVVWNNGHTDDKGLALEEFIQKHELVYANLPGHLATFSTANGESNIDVTLASSASYSMR